MQFQRGGSIMKRLMLPAMVAIVMGLLTSGCTGGARAVIPTYNNPVENIVVPAGDEFVIELAYDPDEGYLWYEEYDGTKLQLLESTCAFCRVGEEEFVTRQGFGLGLPGYPSAFQYSRFRTLSKGEAVVTMAYKDSPTADAVEERIFTVIIE
jgi:predicted secreted protein